MKRTAATLLVALALGACSTSPTVSTGGNDADLRACSYFRAVAGGASDGGVSEPGVVEGLKTLDSQYGQQATTPAIRDNIKAMDDDAEATALALINGGPNDAADALAEECNSRFPLNP